jgi:hypothetical protein
VAGWGVSGFGIAPYGGLSFVGLPTLTLVSADALDTRTVRVVTSADMQVQSDILDGDGTNPDTWLLTRDDTGVVLPIASVDIDGQTATLHLLTDLAKYAVFHTVSTTTLKGATGEVVQAPTSQSFHGLAESAEAMSPRSLIRVQRDLANLAAPRNPLGGTLQVGSDGDYRNVDGVEYERRMLLRRLWTRPGDFFHIPKYGIGLREKEPLPVSSLNALAADIRTQILSDGTIKEAAVQLSFKSSVLVVEVRAKLAGGVPLAVSTPFPEVQVVF